MDQALLAAAAASSSSMNVDSLIQSALAAGIPLQQVVQFVQQRQALQQPQQSHHLSASQTPVGSSATPGVSQPHQPSLSGFSLANAASMLSQQQSATAAHQQAQQMASMLHQAQQQQALSQQQSNANLNALANTGNKSNSLPWPIFQPTVNVPYFDMNTYQKVNLDVQASALPSGMDLPLHDMNTLRFFFNFGVHHARAILLREHFHIATPNGQQSGSAGVGQTQQQLQAQSQVSSALLGLQQHQDSSLYQQALLKATPDALSAASNQGNKSMTGSLQGAASSSTDQNTMFQLQRDLSTSISINQLQNTLAQMNKITDQSALAQQRLGGNFKSQNDQIEALLLQNSILGQHNQAMQFPNANSATNALSNAHHQTQSQQQSQPEGLHRPTAIMASSLPLGLTSGKSNQPISIQAQQQIANGGLSAQTQQQQLLGGLGISAVAQQQVPVDPAPRSTSNTKPGDSQITTSTTKPSSVANPVPLTSSVLASFLQEQQAHDRMKPTSLVRGAIADVARPVATPVSSAPIVTTSNPQTSSAPPTSTGTGNGFLNGGQMSLAAQLSAAMMAGAFFQQQQQRGAANQPPVSSNLNTLGSVVKSEVSTVPNNDGRPPAGLNVSKDDPNAHLLAGTSPFVKLIGTTATSRSLTAGTSNIQQANTTSQAENSQSQVATTSSTAALTSQANSLSQTRDQMPAAQKKLSFDLDPTTFLATTELNYTEAFRRSHDQRETGTPDNQRRKSGIYMLPANSGNEQKDDSGTGIKKKPSTEKPIGPTMINYVNSCLNQLKSQVQSHGVGLPVDSQFRPIDYSSRPIDAIFRKAREQLDRDRDFTPHRASVSPALLQRLHANAQMSNQAEEGHHEVAGDDGAASAPASTNTATSLTLHPAHNTNSRSRSEQPTEGGVKRRADNSESPIIVTNGDENEHEKDGSPGNKRQRVEDSQQASEDTPSSA